MTFSSQEAKGESEWLRSGISVETARKALLHQHSTAIAIEYICYSNWDSAEVARFGMALVSVIEASQRLGISTHTIKRWLKKGELKGEQQATPQGFVWLVEVADESVEFEAAVANGSDAIPTGTAEWANHFEEVIELLKSDLEARDRQINFLKEELEARRREVQELHVLLQRAQAALPAPKEARQSWWHRLWQRQR